MKNPYSSLPKAHFDKETLTCTMRDKTTGNQVPFKCLQVPEYFRDVIEREDLGGGWYGGRIIVRKSIPNCFVVVDDDKVMGILYNPYMKTMKSDVVPVNEHTDMEIMRFINQNNLKL
jgi:hypothetical protein